jgi:hypothetical protein
MYQSKLASLIDEAVQDCITYGYGKATQHVNGVDLKILALWADTEEHIEVAIYENQVLRFSYFEQIPEEYREEVTP